MSHKDLLGAFETRHRKLIANAEWRVADHSIRAQAKIPLPSLQRGVGSERPTLGATDMGSLRVRFPPQSTQLCTTGFSPPQKTSSFRQFDFCLLRRRHATPSHDYNRRSRNHQQPHHNQTPLGNSGNTDYPVPEGVVRGILEIEWLRTGVIHQPERGL